MSRLSHIQSSALPPSVVVAVVLFGTDRFLFRAVIFCLVCLLGFFFSEAAQQYSYVGQLILLLHFFINSSGKCSFFPSVSNEIATCGSSAQDLTLWN